MTTTKYYASSLVTDLLLFAKLSSALAEIQTQLFLVQYWFSFILVRLCKLHRVLSLIYSVFKFQ